MRCKGCYTETDLSRCEPCRLEHNARETARRQERQRLRRCWVCGVKATKGERTCPTHERYRSERAAS